MATMDSISASRAEIAVSEFMTQVYVWMAFGLAVTGGLSWYTANSEPFMNMLFGHGMTTFWVLFFVQLGIVFFLSAKAATLNPTVASGLFVLYAALNGMLLAPMFMVYTDQSIASAFFITAGTFGAMSVYGYTTKRDLSGWGSFLMMGLIGVIIASVVNIWMRNEMMMWVISYITVFVFVGLTAYDTQKLKNIARNLGKDENLRSNIAILGALTLYLDFINLFITILRITGKRR